MTLFACLAMIMAFLQSAQERTTLAGIEEPTFDLI